MLEENKKMAHIFIKRYPHARQHLNQDGIHMVMDFEPAAESDQQ
jgi:hypothetical protein